MAKRKKTQEVDVGTLKVGDQVVFDGDAVRTIVKLEKVIDPHGRVFQDTLETEWYVKFEDGHRDLLSGSVTVQAA